jgi:hypothetical protein
MTVYLGHTHTHMLSISFYLVSFFKFERSDTAGCTCGESFDHSVITDRSSPSQFRMPECYCLSLLAAIASSAECIPVLFLAWAFKLIAHASGWDVLGGYAIGFLIAVGSYHLQYPRMRCSGLSHTHTLSLSPSRGRQCYTDRCCSNMG